MMVERADHYISGGYFVTTFVDGAKVNPWLRSVAQAQEDLMPERFLSVAWSEAAHVPTFSWTGSLDEDFTMFGIPLEKRAELEAWADARFDTEIGYPNVFCNLATVREYVAKFSITPDVIQLLGIGLHKDRLDMLAELERLGPPYVAENGSKVSGFQDNGFARALHMGKNPEPGEIVGFDLICCNYNIDDSWVANGLPVEALKTFNFRPNRFGLIDDKANADKLADYCNRPDAHMGEPGIWLPVLVTRYPVII